MVDVVKISEYLNPNAHTAYEADDVFYIPVSDADIEILGRYENRIIECNAVDDLDPTAVNEQEKPAIDLINNKINASDSNWREQCERFEDLTVRFELFMHVAVTYTDNVQAPALLN